MSIFTDPALGLRGGPFQPRLEEQSRSKAWYGWAGYIAPASLDNVEFEYFALRNQAALFDISPMKKYRITGPDALTAINRLITRDAAKIRVGRVGYCVWCDEEGMVIDDGTLFRLAENDWRLCCQEPMLTWLLDATWGMDADVIDETDTLAALALQGPTSYAILEAAGLEVAQMKPFDHAEVEPGLMISRTGFTGDLGYELWTDRDAALPLWDRIWQASTHQGLRAIGYEAVNIARIEAGYLAAGIDFQPVHATERLHRGQTPFELGLGWQVNWDKGHFNGRRALRAAQDSPRSLLMKLDVEGFKPANGALVYHRKRREVGHITSGLWSPTAKRNIALAHVKTSYARPRAPDLWAEVYTSEEGRWTTRMARLTPMTTPFFAPARARATPPGRL
ncbi:aminomethyltransferase family protein [Roseovarius pelagicus]|uniref:Aminomethyltransferase family protein n=1 Tax=Roseovarius pelagicus TaxID=2980108 RepID=A0ABY6DDZ3_9RHOB|nr:aminomethyltransferase family protein [Roseovarius pelagicus]UXX84295.1 aminomethyltransferase family protein [Roseovarius pelagicus]